MDSPQEKKVKKLTYGIETSVNPVFPKEMQLMQQYVKKNNRPEVQKLLKQHQFPSWFIVSLLKLAVDEDHPQMIILLRRHAHDVSGLREYVNKAENITTRCIQAITHVQPYFCYEEYLKKAYDLTKWITHKGLLKCQGHVNALIELHPILIQICFDDNKVSPNISKALQLLLPDPNYSITIDHIDIMLRSRDMILKCQGSIEFLSDMMEFYTGIIEIANWMLRLSILTKKTEWQEKNNSLWSSMPKEIEKIHDLVSKICKSTSILKLMDSYYLVTGILSNIQPVVGSNTKTDQKYTLWKDEMAKHKVTAIDSNNRDLPLLVQGEDSELLEDDSTLSC